MTVRIIDIAFHRVDEIDDERLGRSRSADGTLIVPTEADANDVAVRAETENAGFILVTDESDTIRGIVVPRWVAHQVSRVMGQPVETFVEAVGVLSSDPRGAVQGYGHEWLNFDRPELYWCEAGHYTDGCPCSVGHQVPCGPGN